MSENVSQFNPSDPPRKRSLLRVIVKSVVAVSAVFFSLMTFPSGLPWLITFWMVLFMVAQLRGHYGLSAIWLGLAIVVVKLPDASPELLMLLGLIAIIAIERSAHWIRNRKKHPGVSRRSAVAYSTILSLALLIFTVRYANHSSVSAEINLSHDRPIVCLGDSLTAAGYPDVLRQKVVPPVIDRGREGIKTRDGVKQIAEILALDPQAVILELGGHDFNNGHPRSDAKANLIEMIEAFQNAGIAVVLVEVPRGFISDTYYGLERQLARRYDLELISDWTIRSFVLMSPIIPPGQWMSPKTHRSRDGLHPNDRGNEAFAHSVARALEKVFGPDILK